MRSARLLSALVVLGVVAGCSGPDTSPVPVEVGAEDAVVCDGVSQRAAELILGGQVVLGDDPRGSWGDAGRGFTCVVVRADDRPGKILVFEWELATYWGVNEEGAEQMMSGEWTRRIEADAPGVGYVGTRPEGFGSARWVCDGRLLMVDLIGVETAGRDKNVDAEALLVSMLPWTCGDAEVPERATGA